MDFYASSSGEEEELGAVNFALSREAYLLFQPKKYFDCIDILNQLLLTKPHDPKVLHNIAITKYFSGGCSDPKELLDELIDVKRKCEDQALASNESAGGNKDISDSKENRRVEHQTSAASNARTAEFGTSITSLNIALICYHLHGYSKALSLLEPIYQNIESIDECCVQGCYVMVDQQVADLSQLIPTGTCMSIDGVLKHPPPEAKLQKIELSAEKVNHVGTVDPAKYPLPKTRLTLEFLRDFLHLHPRTNTISAVARIRNALAFATHSFFQKHGFLYVHTPIITTSDCEGAGEMFQVTTLISEAERVQKELIKNPPPSEANLEAAKNCCQGEWRGCCTTEIC